MSFARMQNKKRMVPTRSLLISSIDVKLPTNDKMSSGKKL